MSGLSSARSCRERREEDGRIERGSSGWGTYSHDARREALAARCVAAVSGPCRMCHAVPCSPTQAAGQLLSVAADIPHACWARSPKGSGAVLLGCWSSRCRSDSYTSLRPSPLRREEEAPRGWPAVCSRRPFFLDVGELLSGCRLTQLPPFIRRRGWSGGDDRPAAR